MSKVVVHRVGSRKAVHELRAVSFRRFENQVEMVQHANEQVQPDVVLLNSISQAVDEATTVPVVNEQSAALHPMVANHPTGNMVYRTGKLDSQLPRHVEIMARLLAERGRPTESDYWRAICDDYGVRWGVRASFLVPKRDAGGIPGFG